MYFQITSSTVGRSIFVGYSDGATSLVPNDHPKFDDIVKTLTENGSEDEVRDLIDGPLNQIKVFVALSERVSLKGNKLFFDGDRLKGALSKHIIRMSKDGLNPAPFVKFMEKLATNPSEKSREDLFRWLKDRNFTITEDGDFLAYKGVHRDGSSVHAGYGIRNGEEVNGNIKNEIGDVIEMPRSQVDDNSNIGCSHGLHAGTREYAEGFAPYDGIVVTVSINPRDVVSVPTDAGDEKLRVCRYKVIDQDTKEYAQPVWSDAVDSDTDCDYPDDGDDSTTDDDDLY